MRKQRLSVRVAGLVLLAMAGGAGVQEAAGDHQVGVGAHYWKALDDIDTKDVDEDGFSYAAMYRYRYDWIGLEAGVEYFKKGFGGAGEAVYQPQAYLLVGKVLYAGAGIGGYYTDGEWGDKPFYALRAGLDIPILPILHLDIQAHYRFEEWSDLSDKAKDIDTDTVTLGAAARLAF